MKVLKVEQREDKRMYLEIEVDGAAFEDAMEKSYRKNVKKINIPGFRKGHAPRRIIEKYYTEAVFYDDAINFVCPDAYDKAVEETKIDPVDMPEIDIVKLEKGENFVFSALVTVRPEVTLGEYKGITAEKSVNTVTGEEVDAEIKRMQDNAARILTLEEGECAEQDKVDLDFDGSVDGVSFEGGKGENYSLVLGSGSFIPGFEEQIVGKKIGEEFDVNVTFPEDYHAEDLKGKAAVFKCKVNKLERKELPELDDEFAKDVSEFDTLEELKKDTEKKILAEKEAASKRAFENAVVETVAENAEVDIPNCMIEKQLDGQIRDISYRLQSQGMPLEQYLQYTGMTMEALRDQLRDEAKKTVKTSLVITEIAKKENIEVTDEDIEAEYKTMADMYKMEPEKIKEMMGGQTEALVSELKARKTVDFIVGEAKEGKPKAQKKATKKAENADADEEKPAKKTAKKTAEKQDEKPAKKTAAKKTVKKTEEKTASEKKKTAKKKDE